MIEAEPLPIEFQRRATREVEEIDRWWREHRPASPDLFASELERMLSVVALVPALGAPARHERAQQVRRVLLRNSQFYVYYRVHAGRLQVLAVWHTARRSGPGL